MGDVIFALDTQVFIKISNVHRNLKGQMKLDLCIGEALSYMHVTIETAFVGVAINYHYYYILFYSTILLVSNYEISIFHT